MIIPPSCKAFLLAAVLAGAVAAPAMAQVTINIGVAPPAAQYEAVPVLAPNQTWAPGYWAWNGDRHIWVRGHAIMKRDGYRWAPDNWVHTGNGYSRQQGYWVRDASYREKEKKEKKPKKPKHNKHHGDHPGKGHGHGHGPKH